MKAKIFVDGQAGTTGLEIHERLAQREDIELLIIDPELRKDINERKKLINASDITFLCLPDDASRESVSLCENDTTRFIDASTAFRTADDWAYGIPELSPAQRTAIANSKRVSNPGCHATGFIVGIKPLIEQGIISPKHHLSCYSITGYSGGGKQLIAAYEAAPADDDSMNCPRHYALGLSHKHLPEMKTVCGLENPPIFMPVLGRYYRGMTVTMAIPTSKLEKKFSAQEVHSILEAHYANEHFVRVQPFGSDEGLDNGILNATECNNTNNLDLFVFGDENQVVIASRFDNLGKGASGAAVQNMNIMLDFDEKTGL
ncbi:MAG: N-acetyl-gamma-glutamyl-phosphate reductase [Fibrobacterales bacterium]